MTRLLILVAIVVGVAWWLFGRRRKDGDAAGPPTPGPAGGKAGGARKPPSKATAQATSQIVACAHCGVHLPREETVVDAEGRVFCGEPHRLAGPR